tara:strand:+ start:1419 stop:1736 length:318 start_codon:yes stop_codon:yes gene_type:complete
MKELSDFLNNHRLEIEALKDSIDDLQAYKDLSINLVNRVGFDSLPSICSHASIFNTIYKKHYNVIRIGTWFAVSNKCVPTCENDACGYSLSLEDAINQAESKTRI